MHETNWIRSAYFRAGNPMFFAMVLAVTLCSARVEFEFIINLKAAKQIGLTIPPKTLARADRVIR